MLMLSLLHDIRQVSNVKNKHCIPTQLRGAVNGHIVNMGNNVANKPNHIILGTNYLDFRNGY